MKKTILALTLLAIGQTANATPIVDRLDSNMTRKDVMATYADQKTKTGEYLYYHILPDTEAEIMITYIDECGTCKPSNRNPDAPIRSIRVKEDKFYGGKYGPLILAKLTEKYGKPDSTDTQTDVKPTGKVFGIQTESRQTTTYYRWTKDKMNITFKAKPGDGWKLTFDVLSDGAEVNL